MSALPGGVSNMGGGTKRAGRSRPAPGRREKALRRHATRGSGRGLTLHEIAAWAATSKSTVSRVLRNEPRVAAETRERIRTLGADGGYICCPDQLMPYPPENIEAMVTTAREHGRLHT